MAPHTTFELFGKSKKKLKKRTNKSKGTKSKSSTSSSTSTATFTSDKPKKKKPKKSTKSKPPSNTDKNSKLAKLEALTALMPPSHSPTPVPVATKITYADKEVQTEMKMTAVVNDDNDIVTVSKEVAEAQKSLVQSLRNSMQRLETEISELKLKNMQFENNLLTKNDSIELFAIEKEAMLEETETLKEQIEEYEIAIESLHLDIEDLRDERDQTRERYLSDLDIGQQYADDILLQNKCLKETLENLKTIAMKEMNEKNNEILQLSLKNQRILTLEKHINELELEKEKLSGVESELFEFKRQVDLNSDTDRIIEILSTKNMELEFEVKRLNECMQHCEEMTTVYANMEHESSEYISELNEEIKLSNFKFQENSKKLDKAQRELRHSQNTVFEFKDHVRKLEETKRKMLFREDSLASTKQEQKLQKEMLLRSNLELQERLNNMKSQLINYANISSSGFAHCIEKLILQKHIPKQIKCDYGSMQFLAFLQRVSFKVRFSKEVMDSFYIGENTTKDMMKDSQIKDLYKVLEICPILVKHDRFIESIQRALIQSYPDKFNDAVNHWPSLIKVEDTYDKLLDAVKDDDIRGEIAISDVFSCNDLYRTYLMKLFADFSPEQKYRAKDKVDKWAIFEILERLKYAMLGMKIKTHEMNDVIAKMNAEADEVHNLGIKVVDDIGVSAPTDDIGDAMDDGQSAVEKPMRKRHLLIGVIQKMEELEGTCADIVSRALKYCIPVRCSYFGKRSNVNKLREDNYIGMAYDFVFQAGQYIRALNTKQTSLLEKLKDLELEKSTHFENIGKINRFLDAESESSENGLIPILERLYDHVKGLPYALEQLYSTAADNDMITADAQTDELDNLEMAKKHKSNKDTLYFAHLELEAELKKIDKDTGEALLDEQPIYKNDEEMKQDLRTQLFGKKLTPWMHKAKAIREELEQADILKDALESANAEIKYKHKELVVERGKSQTVKSTLDVVTLELKKQKQQNRDLVHFEVECKTLKHSCSEFETDNLALKSETDKLKQMQNELNGQIKHYQKTISAMKLQNNKRKPRTIDGDHHNHMPSMSGHAHSMNVSPNSHLHRRSSSHSLRRSATLKPGGGVGGAGDVSYERATLLNRSHSAGKHDNGREKSWYHSFANADGSQEAQFIIENVTKQLDLSRSYNVLLEKTINSLRRNNNIYDLKKQWVDIRRDLKPLPVFGSMSENEYKQYLSRKGYFEHNKKLYELRKQQKKERLIKENKDINASNVGKSIRDVLVSLSPPTPFMLKNRTNKTNIGKDLDTIGDDEEFDVDIEKSSADGDDDDDVKVNNQNGKMKGKMKEGNGGGFVGGKDGGCVSSLERKMMKRERYENMQKLLGGLQCEFGEIFANPRVVNLEMKSKKNVCGNLYDQTIIGRNLRLRELKIKCVELKKECLNIESNFVCKNDDDGVGVGDGDGLKQQLIPIGRIDIEGMSENVINKTKVCLNRNNVVKLQKYLNVLC